MIDYRMIDYRESDQTALLATLANRYDTDWNFPHSGPRNPKSYHFGNDQFNQVDAEIFYAMIRYIHPKKVVEIGPGWQTLLVRQAAQDEGFEIKSHTGVGLGIPGFVYDLGIDVRTVTMDNVPRHLFLDLEAGDLLSVDGGHVWATGNEVDQLHGWILDALQPGVWVHIHDIFLPQGYPEQWSGRGYDEQEHLRTYLEERPEYQVQLALNYLHTQLRGSLSIIPTYDPNRSIGPGSFWIMRPEGTSVSEEAEATHEFQSDRSGKRCLKCGKGPRAKEHS